MHWSPTPVCLQPVANSGLPTTPTSAVNANTVKYEAARILQDIDPSDPAAYSKAKAALQAKFPTGFTFDDVNQNILLDGGSGFKDDAAGYIGWRDRGQGPTWQWMCYNVSVKGPAGETT